MLQRFGLWPVGAVLVVGFGLAAWAGQSKSGAGAVSAASNVCGPPPAFAAASPAVTTGAMAPDDAFKKYLPWKADLPEVKTTESGLQYIELAKGPGTGAPPTDLDRVAVLYDGRLAKGGTKFDATEGDNPAVFDVGGVIPGWTEGLKLMKPGDQFLFFIPAKIAYGPQERGPIPANSDLMFVVTLKNVVATRKPHDACWTQLMTGWPAAKSASLTIQPPAHTLHYFSVADGPKTENPPAETDIVSLYLDARLLDGSVLGTNFGSDQPLEGPAGEVGRSLGLGDILKKMRPGDHWFVQVPVELAFPGPGPKPDKPVVIEVLLDKIVRVPQGPATESGIVIPDAPPAPQ